MEKVVIMFPDFKGEGILGEFGKRLRLAVGRYAILMPVLNGLDIEEVDEMALEVSNTDIDSPEPVFALAHYGKGLKSALIRGYDIIIKRFSEEHYIVRLDTAEHPPEAIPPLLSKAEKAVEMYQSGRIAAKRMIIGDLSFVSGQNLRPESVDEFAHLNIFPSLYGQFTGGLLPLSCAHGFQVFTPGIVRRVFKLAQRITGEAEKELGKPVEWGFDGAMALAGYALGLATIEKVPAESMRDRKTAKIAEQFDRALRMCRAAERIFISLRKKEDERQGRDEMGLGSCADAGSLPKAYHC